MESSVFWIWFIGIPVLFLAIVLYVFRHGARGKYRRDAEIPFKEDGDQRRR